MAWRSVVLDRQLLELVDSVHFLLSVKALVGSQFPAFYAIFNYSRYFSNNLQKVGSDNYWYFMFFLIELRCVES